MSEYYNSLPDFEIIQALVKKRDYSWLCIILLLTSACSFDELKLSYPSQEDLQMFNCGNYKQFLVFVHADDSYHYLNFCHRALIEEGSMRIEIL